MNEKVYGRYRVNKLTTAGGTVKYNVQQWELIDDEDVWDTIDVFETQDEALDFYSEFCVVEVQTIVDTQDEDDPEVV